MAARVCGTGLSSDHGRVNDGRQGGGGGSLTVTKTLATLFVLVIATGCNKFMPTLSLGNSPTHETPAPVLKTVVIAGQSNATHLYGWGGHWGWNDVDLPNYEWINCASDATSTLDWQPGAPVMERCIKQIGDRHVDAILWYQGEADAQQGLEATYESRTRTTWDYFRSHWGDVPIVYAQLSTYDPNKWPAQSWDQIKAIQAGMHYHNSYMIKTDDITPGGPTSGGDGIHFSDEFELGRRFGLGYRLLIGMD